ncbi:uncharacterized protein SETTUDRAFT_108891 [Exserohilum turcica Et28A]|uniref:Uncharacterized protein n=1 Tax=Exserohilum turcicum (strain 28A) TaxID=671987 RepID=R0ISI9_EXST2|nr:uncharacterized protein SETTUDRAFT_108891 [Exserohilum turcica Et28A]EOA87810.1 hypothetical protein SETTUDRAFT_108891 [Exserohilum turcica Et28A]
MGGPYRTPSPARESYISSSNVNSPERSPLFGSDSEEFFDYTQDTDYSIEQPKTPTKKRVPLHWHGMLSPQTPGFGMHASKSQSPCLSDGTGDTTATETSNSLVLRDKQPQDVFTSANESDVEMAGNDVERDAILARQLEESPSPTQTRRSARLRRQAKPEYNLKQLADTARPVRKPNTSEDASTQPELSIVPCKSEPVPFEGLPAVHSLSWQLQYPPGGSTHPSYPYPVLDPRLIFHPPFVPIVDGLPDIARVPKLVLPMHWRHVSWAGLLPVVFDPYQQAFKLTPVGPLPLTCEELRQGGLHEYVPGGKLHPEYGLLPDMLKLSDGSDAEVFDFDGVDWTLPWEGQMDFHAPCALRTLSNTRVDSAVSPTASAMPPSIDAAMLPWREARDCPNTIIDLADAWRWLAAKETNPTADFVPTPGKRWHGRGAYRSSRKFKSPIPELMMFALDAATAESLSPADAVLQNQDTPIRGKAVNDFCPFKSVATPASVDITLLGDTEFTVVELLSYFPLHYYWGHAAERLATAGFSPRTILDMICLTRALDAEAAPRLSTIAGVVRDARKRGLVKEDIEMQDEQGKETSSTPAATPEVPKPRLVDLAPGYTAEGWSYDSCDKIDYPLLALAHGVQALPAGVDAGPLTALILWCRQNGRYQVLLSEVPGLLREAQIEPLIEPGEGGCPDKEVLGRYAEALKTDRLRVARLAGARKRAMEALDEGKTKRKKVE